jgi:cytidylate kinase
MKKPLRIAISGLSGCGNTTLSRLLADRLGLKCINYTFRNLAQEKGISFEEMCALAQEDDQWDIYLDRHQVEMARKESCVLASRLAIWFLREADCKIYLYASPEVRFKRIAHREGKALEEVARITQERDERDVRRYRRLYNVDLLDLEPADLILNTDLKSSDVLVEEILVYLGQKDLV